MLEEWQARSRTRSVSHVTRFIDEKQRPQKLKEGKESRKREDQITHTHDLMRRKDGQTRGRKITGQK
jgi:hypothetical protein